MAGGSAAAGPPRLASAAAEAAPITAVATLAGGAAVGGPGVHILAHLASIGSEVVRGTPAALAALGRSPQVTGLRPDAPVTPTGTLGSAAGTGDGVRGWQGLGAPAGRPEAGRDVTVAVVDTGISDTAGLNRASGHLVDGVDTSALASAGAGVGAAGADGGGGGGADSDGFGDGSGGVRTRGAFTDGYGHGTFIANLIAGGRVSNTANWSMDDPALGVAPGARVVSVKVADDSGITSLAAVLAGLDWVASHRPMDIVSLALSADRPGAAYGADPLTAAIRHLRDTGLTVLVAAGNTAGQLSDPGFEPQALTVGAADTTGQVATVAPFSGSGTVYGVRKPDLVAPGVRLLSQLPAESWLARNNPTAKADNGYWRGSGTSQATAVAAGVAAIYLAEHPAAGPAAVKAKLRGAASAVNAWRAGTGLLTVPQASDEADYRDGTLDEGAWNAGQWDSEGWAKALDESWARTVWTATSWSNGSWSGGSWSINPWAGEAWPAKSWSAKSWSAKSWSAKSWSAKSWSAKSWSAKSWSSYGWATGPGDQ